MEPYHLNIQTRSSFLSAKIFVQWQIDTSMRKIQGFPHPEKGLYYSQRKEIRLGPRCLFALYWRKPRSIYRIFDYISFVPDSLAV